MASENSAKNIIVWLIVGLIVAALAIGLSMPQLMPTQGGGVGPQTLVKVHGQELRNSDWTYQFRVMASTLGGFSLKDADQQKTVRARETALEALVEREIAYHAAEKAGLRATVEDAEDLVKQGLIVSMGRSYFWKDPEEPFNYDIFKSGHIPRFMVNERDYLEHQRRATLARTLYDTIGASAAVAENELRAYYEMQSDRIALRLLRLPLEAFAKLTDPTAAELSQYVQANDEALTKDAESQKNRFADLEAQIDISLIAIPKGDTPDVARAQAMALLDRLGKGESFAALARENSHDDRNALDGGHYGFINIQAAKQSPESIDLDSALLATAADLAPHSTSGLIEGATDFFIVRSGDRREGTLDVDSIKREIARPALRLELGQKLAQAKIREIRSRLNDKTTLTDLSALDGTEGLNVEMGPGARIDLLPENVPSFPRGNEPMTVSSIPNLAEHAWAAGEAGTVLAETYSVDQSLVIAEVSARQTPTDEEFETQKEQLRIQMTQQRAESLIRDFLKSRCESALGHGDIAPNAAQIRRLLDYGDESNNATPFNVCAQVGSRGGNLSYAYMLRQLAAQYGGGS